MYPHVIRLRGPWELESTAADDDRPRPAPGPLRLPARWADGPLAGFAGRASLRRHFGYPGRLDADERVWLTIAGAAGCRAVSVNEHPGPLPAGGGYEWDVTAVLRPRNVLRLVVEGNAARDGLPGEVALEVRRTAWLREVKVAARGAGIVATGEVVGHSGEALDLYLIADRRCAAEARVTPSDNGERFCLQCDAPASAVTVDLVGGAVVWYRVERAVTGG